MESISECDKEGKKERLRGRETETERKRGRKERGAGGGREGVRKREREVSLDHCHVNILLTKCKEVCTPSLTISRPIDSEVVSEIPKKNRLSNDTKRLHNNTGRQIWHYYA